MFGLGPILCGQEEQAQRTANETITISKLEENVKSSIKAETLTSPYNYVKTTLNAEKLFSEGRSMALYHAGVLLTKQDPIVRMGTQVTDVYLVISMDNIEETTSANCLNSESVGKLTKHVMHSTASLVSQSIESMGIPVTVKSHLKDSHKLPITAFSNMQVQQAKGWLSSSSSNEEVESTTTSTTAEPVAETLKSPVQGDEPKFQNGPYSAAAEKYPGHIGADDPTEDNANAAITSAGVPKAVQATDFMNLDHESLDGEDKGESDRDGIQDRVDDYVIDVEDVTNFDEGITRAVFDLDQLELEFGPDCCQDCICRSYQIGTEEVIDIGQPIEALTVTIDNLSLTGVTVTAVDKSPEYAWLLMTPDASVVIGVLVQNSIPSLKTGASEFKLTFENSITVLRVMVSIQGCIRCSGEAKLTFEKTRRIKRSLLTDWIGTIDSNEFFKQVEKLHEQADLDRKAIEDEDKELRNELSKARVARRKVSDMVGSIADRVCQNNAIVNALQLQMELKIHSSNIANHVANEISMCRTDSLPPMVSKEEISRACDDEYPLLCGTGEFLFAFMTATSCKVQAVVMSEDTIVLKMVITYPKGPQVKYNARHIAIVPVFNDDGSKLASFKIEDQSMLIRTASGHLTVISQCQSKTMLHQKTWICDIENVDQVATRCMKLLLQEQGQINGKARQDCIEFSDSAQECFVKRVSNMLWTSSRVPLPIVDTDAKNLHGFWDQSRTNVIKKGVNLVTKQAAKAIQCEGFIYETQFSQKKLDIVEMDHFSAGININVDIIKLHKEERRLQKDLEESEAQGIGFKVNQWFKKETNKRTIGIGSFIFTILVLIALWYCLKCTSVGARMVSSFMLSIRRCCPCLRTRLQYGGSPANDRNNRNDSIEMS